MKVLVVGGGGREHALAWKLGQSPRVERVFVAPGNGGTAVSSVLRNVEFAGIPQLRDWALQERVTLTVVGPEGPLADGLVDDFRAHGLRVFGPTRAAAQLESSKAFSKAFMVRHGIPTAVHATFSDRAEAHTYIQSRGAPIVVKADGLAAGKGVVVAPTLAEALAAVDRMLPAQADAGTRVVVEEFLAGEEASFMVVCDGKDALALATSQDHKRLLDGDQGPNTGGMGAYSPAPVVTPAVHARAMREVILPTLRGMEKDGIAYTGFLYAGLMIDPQGRVKTLEFNCRLGDPETQPILMRLKSDLFELLMVAAETGAQRRLDQFEIEWDRRSALGVVLAAHGYPATPRTGDVIQGIPTSSPDAMVFHAATQRDGDVPHTTGGRVLCATALGDNVRQAQERAYALVDAIHFDGMQCRRDIGHRAVGN
ncbi:MAG: phosphoribosylamine--glycine ligase [Burkholderiaceae bacterium]